MCLRVPFGSKQPIGVLLEVTDTSELAMNKLKEAIALVDPQPLLPADILRLLQWVSHYYHHPIGEVCGAAVPAQIRKGRTPDAAGEKVWRITQAGREMDIEDIKRAPKQKALMTILYRHEDGLRPEELNNTLSTWRPAMKSLVDKGWVEVIRKSGSHTPLTTRQEPLALNEDQARAVKAVAESLGQFQAFLLDGVTGSGKTEVYLQLADKVLAQGKQLLILVPEIGLTPQIVKRFQQRFALPIAVLHSGLSDQERMQSWLMAKEGKASIVIGTRSAVFTPLKKPGLIILDEEHDPSFKQQEGLRYSARDVAVVRAQASKIPILLGSATPSIESVYNCKQGRYDYLQLPKRAGKAIQPKIHALDIRSQNLKEGLSEQLLKAMCTHLQKGGQVLLFLNRRGFAPTLICHECGWLADCKRCDSHMTYHQHRQRLCCHHCGIERPVVRQCPECGSPDLRPLGLGTERLEQVLQQQFPEYGIVRIDRDNTRRKGSMEALLKEIHDGHGQILIGTQMLAKGHHFPNVTLVGILDAEQGLFSVDFRAGERMAQMMMQVAGRAGRADRPGQVLIQTHHPDHPLLRCLLDEGYQAFTHKVLEERQQAELPPFSAMVLLRAEATEASSPMAFLELARDLALAYEVSGLMVLGPVPSPMEKRAGRFRAQLLLQSKGRQALHRLLEMWVPQLETMKSSRKVRWSLDVDPMDMY
jgi:primosomal protein N' (replication factor Y)